MPFAIFAVTLPTADDPKKLELFAKANEHRIASKFDLAKRQYESIIAQYPDDNEAYWCKLLCVYGIEYVDDDLTEKKIPTCHRTVTESIFDNKEYKLIMSRASAEEKAIYEAEAKEIDRIQKEILAKADKEEPYDIFICYKESENDSKKRTVDAQHATKIYTYLTEHGYKVFFSRITLKGKLGLEYEPVIYSALKSAKVMLHVTTSIEHTNAPWVRNEWSRFLEFMNSDVTKTILPCIAQMGPYELPEELGRFQVADMTDLDFYENLLLQINKKFGKNIEKKSEEKQEKTIKKSKQTEQYETNDGNKVPDQIHNFLSRAKLYLEDGDYAKANEFAENCLNIHFEFADAYVIKLLCDFRVDVLSKIVQKPDFFNNPNYKKAVRFASGSLKAELENLEKQYYYNVAISCGNDLLSPKNYARIKENLEKAKGYKQADEMLASLPNFKAEQKKAKNYDLALPLLKCDLTDNETYEKLEKHLTDASDYMDAKQLLKSLPQRRQEQIDAKALAEKQKNYESALRLIKSDLTVGDTYKRAEDLLTKADDYKNAKQLLESLPRRKQEQINAQILAEKQKNYALALPLLKADLLDDDNYSLVKSYLVKANDYKDAKQLLENLPNLRAEQEKAEHYKLALQYLKSDFTVGTNYKKAEELLTKADEYKDAKDLLESLPQRKQEQIDAKVLAEKKRNYELALPLLKSDLTIHENYKNAQTYLEKADDYKDAKQLLDQLPKKRDAQIREAERRKKKKRITMAIIAAASAVLVVFIVLLFSLIIPSANFTKATSLLNNGNYHEAISTYEGLNGWGNSKNKIEVAYALIEIEEYHDYEYGIRKLLDNGTKVTITYDCKDGELSSLDRSSETTFVYTKSSEFNGLPILTKDYYSCSWQLSYCKPTISADSNKVSLKFVLNWIPIDFNIKYNLNGGTTNENPKSYTVENDISLVKPKKTGYTFVGWTGTDLTDRTMTVTIPKGSIGDREYTAYWEVNTYKVTYNANGGTASKTEDTATYDSYFSLASVGKREGCTFDGWYDSAGNKYTSGVWKIDKNVTLIAKWNTELEYTLSGNSYSVTGINVTKDNYTILSTYNGKPVTSIGEYAFSDCKSLTSIEIPNSVTSIGYQAFYECDSLTSIEIPNSVTSIGSGAFSNCPIETATIPTTAIARVPKGKLKTVVINGGTSIGERAFYDCSSLTSIKIPDSVTSIGEYAFCWCTSLTSIEILDGVTSIGEYAFSVCYSLTSVTIPSSVTSIGENAFSNCSKLTIYCEVASKPSGWGSGWNYSKRPVVWNCKNNDVADDGYIYTIMDEICYAIKGNTAKVVGTNVSGDIVIPSNITYNSQTYIVTSIGSSAFYNCDSLTRIEIPNSITSIGSYAFSRCESLTSVTIPNSVTSIGEDAFYNCSSITSITIPSSVTSIGEGAFEGCSGLISIEIPASVTSIGRYAFDDCDKLTIYCEVASKPSGWDNNWNYSSRPVVWGYKRKE